MSTGSRSTIAGTMTRDASRSSTTLTGIARASHSEAIQRFDARRPVATIARRTPARSSGTNSRSTTVEAARRSAASSSGTTCGATRVIARARAFEQRRLAQRHLTTADDEDFLRAQIEEERKVLQGGYRLERSIDSGLHQRVSLRWIAQPEPDPIANNRL